MKCPSNYAELTCPLTGCGYIHTPVGIGAREIKLIKNHASNFPDLQEGEFFFAYVTDACTKHCTKVKVVGVDKTTDTLTIEVPTINCIPSMSRICYETSSVEAIREIAAGVGIDVVHPLVYDCETRTLSIDCQGLRELMDNCKAEVDNA